MRRGLERDTGNAMILALMMVFLMVALTAGQFAVVQKNTWQAEFMSMHEDLRSYADSGAHLAVHDLSYSVTGYEGKVGTENWTTANDLGHDGLPSTGDLGEGNGLPDFGEPNVVPVSVGPSNLGIGLIVYVDDSGYSEIKRIVARASRGDAESVVEAYARSGVVRFPRAGAVYMDPRVALDLRGNAFRIDGRDTNPDGTPGPGPDTFGIATSEGDPPGSNQTDIVDQIPSAFEDSVLGIGGTPSVGETTEDVDVDALFAAFLSRPDQEFGAGTYADFTWGTPDSPLVTYVSGDVVLSGTGSGAGVLLVDGNLEMSGRWEFQGVVIVRGDVRQTGGGSITHIWGSLIVSQSITLLDDPDLSVTGNADVVYSSQTLADIESLLSASATYTVLYWNYLK